MTVIFSLIPKSSENITEKLYELCKGLRRPVTKRVYKDSLLNLIEIMDEKSDVYVHCCRSNRKLENFQERIKSKTMKVRIDDIREIVSIIDQIFCLFTMWLSDKGYTLSETIFTCIYTHYISRIESKYLRLACSYIIKIIDKIYDYAAKIEYTNNAKLNLTVPSNILMPIEEKYLKSEKIFADIKSFINAARKSDNIVEETKWDAIYYRLRFFETFIELLDKVPFDPERQNEDFKTPIFNYINSCLAVWTNSTNTGVQKPNINAYNKHLPYMDGFDPCINYHCVNYRFKSHPKLMSLKDSLDTMRNIILALEHSYMTFSRHNLYFITEHLLVEFEKSHFMIVRLLMSNTYIFAIENYIKFETSLKKTLIHIFKSICIKQNEKGHSEYFSTFGKLDTLYPSLYPVFCGLFKIISSTDSRILQMLPKYVKKLRKRRAIFRQLISLIVESEWSNYKPEKQQLLIHGFVNYLSLLEVKLLRSFLNIKSFYRITHMVDILLVYEVISYTYKQERNIYQSMEGIKKVELPTIKEISCPCLKIEKSTPLNPDMFLANIDYCNMMINICMGISLAYIAIVRSRGSKEYAARSNNYPAFATITKNLFTYYDYLQLFDEDIKKYESIDDKSLIDYCEKCFQSALEMRKVSSLNENTRKFCDIQFFVENIKFVNKMKEVFGEMDNYTIQFDMPLHHLFPIFVIEQKEEEGKGG